MIYIIKENKKMHQIVSQVVPAMVKKTIQLYETMLVRHGVMLVGPTGGGKTTCYEVGFHACTVFIIYSYIIMNIIFSTSISTSIYCISHCFIKSINLFLTFVIADS